MYVRQRTDPEGFPRVKVIIGYGRQRRCVLKNTFSRIQSIPEATEAKLPLGRRRITRVALVLAWAVFWLNTALFPCCEALAVTFGDHSDSHSQTAFAAQPAHHSDESHPEGSHHSPDSPCGHTVDAGPAISGVYAGLPPDRGQWGWFAIDVFVPVGLTAVNHSDNLAPRNYHPPPPLLRLYLRTQRLLI